MSDDLVKRLRDYTCDCFSGNSKHMTWEAAIRIESLEAALRAYYRYVCPTCGGHCSISSPVVQNCPEHLARAALGEKKDG